MDMLINLIVGILSQYTQLSSYHVLYFKCIMILFVNYISIKLQKSKFLHTLQHE